MAFSPTTAINLMLSLIFLAEILRGHRVCNGGLGQIETTKQFLFLWEIF